jgi:hypothetical protein
MQFEGDGSKGEDNSINTLIDSIDFMAVKDFLSWIAYGLMKQQASIMFMVDEYSEFGQFVQSWGIDSREAQIL